NEAAATAPDYVGSAAATPRTGLHAFDTPQIQLLAIPDAHRLGSVGRATVVTESLSYCALRNDRMFVGSSPDRVAPVGLTPRALSDYTQLESDYVNTIKSYSAVFQGSKVYGALYAPFIQVNDPIGPGPAPTRFVPADGHLMGVYARTEQERGIFKAPAGLAA